MTDNIEPEIKTKPKSKLLAIIFLIVAVIYGAIPLDLVPDMILPLGLGDDVLVALGALLYFYRTFFGKADGMEKR